MSERMRVGLERLGELPKLVARLKDKRIGVVAHPASVTRDFSHISSILKSHGIKPRILFGPEHGYGGEAQDMVGVGSTTDPKTGIPIISLYGDRFEDLFPKPTHLKELDLLVIDLADVGARFYTFVWTALLCVREAAKLGVHTIILDRPNPLGGRLEDIEGAHQQEGFCSFVGLEPLPVRHGLTVGELCALFAKRDGLLLGRDEALSIVATDGFPRDVTAADWDRPFLPTSPNMPTFDTALVYPGGCLLEGTNLSEGRGTTRPFEWFGAPWLYAADLVEAIEALKLPGFHARPITFCPQFQKHARHICGGFHLHIHDARKFRPYATYLALIALIAQRYPDQFEFRTEKYEFVDDIPAFDLLTGSERAREGILEGIEPAELARECAHVDRTAAGAVLEEGRIAAEEAAYRDEA